MASARPVVYTLSLHDALPICDPHQQGVRPAAVVAGGESEREPDRERDRLAAESHGEREPRDRARGRARARDRKSTRLNSSHLGISYAVFCLKKKTHINVQLTT